MVDVLIRDGSLRKPNTGLTLIGGYAAQALGVSKGLLVARVDKVTARVSFLYYPIYCPPPPYPLPLAAVCSRTTFLSHSPHLPSARHKGSAAEGAGLRAASLTRPNSNGLSLSLSPVSGIRLGDVVLSVDGAACSIEADFQRALSVGSRSVSGEVSMRISRALGDGEERREVDVRMRVR